MTSYKETELAALFAVEAPVPLPGDWNDVLARLGGGGRHGRVRQRRLPALAGRRRLVVVLAAIALVVVTASALAVSAFLVDRGFIGLPPQGASPSTPPVGKLVLKADGRCTAGGNYCGVWVYADGRLIWIRDASVPGFGANLRTTGLLEQRLTSSGVKLVRSAFVATNQCHAPRSRQKPVDCTAVYPGPAPFPGIANPGWVDGTWGLPPSAWKNSQVRAYVPTKFAFCFVESYEIVDNYWRWRRLELSRLLRMLPTQAATILGGGQPVPFGEGGLGDRPTCLALATDDARRLVRVINHAQIHRLKQPTYVLSYRIELAGTAYEEIWLAPVLPSGEGIRTGGG